MNAGYFFGTRVIVNPFFFLFLLAYALLGLFPQAVVAFAVLLTHELAHLVVAKGYGLEVPELELYPFGGVARVEGMSEADSHAISTMAVAGPLNNFFLAGLGILAERSGLLKSPLLVYFVDFNLGMAFFNFLPAMPLDGGLLYRLFLTRKIGYKKATAKMVKLGRSLGFLLASGSLLGAFMGMISPGLLWLALFLPVAAAREREGAMFTVWKDLAKKKEGLSKNGILSVEQLVVAESTSLKELLRHFLLGKYHLVMVADRDLEIRGILTEGEILAVCLRGDRLDRPVKELLDGHRPLAPGDG